MRVKMLTGATLAAALGVLVSTGSSLGQNDGKTVNSATAPAKKDEQRTALATAALARDVYNFGRESGDTLQIVAAARMLGTVHDALQGSGGEGLEHEGGAAAAAEGDDPALDPAEMLAEARAAAKDDQALIAIIDQSAPKSERSFLASDQMWDRVTTVGPNRDDPWKWRTAIGGEWAEVSISGNGRTDLDLYVYDENENLVCSSTDDFDEEYCSWIPQWTGGFRIVVTNLGSSANTYHMWIM